MARLKTKKRIITRETAIISALIKSKGGPTKCWIWLKEALRKPGFTRQNIVNWRERGYVPLEMVKDIADAFEVSPYLLNYDGYRRVTGENPGTWKELVDESELFI